MTNAMDKKSAFARLRHLTPTQRRLIECMRVHHGQLSCSKRRLAEMLGRNVKTIDRCIADLRQLGLIDVEPTWAENGGQLANTYRLHCES